MTTDVDDASDPEATYRAIGRFIFQFSQLEYSIRHFVALEAGIKDEHFAAVMTHDFAILCTAAFEVLLPSVRDPEAIEELRSLINKARRLNDVRVKVAHGLWVPFKEGGTVHHVSRSKLKDGISVDQAAELEVHSDEAQRIRHAFEQVVWYKQHH